MSGISKLVGNWKFGGRSDGPVQPASPFSTPRSITLAPDTAPGSTATARDEVATMKRDLLGRIDRFVVDRQARAQARAVVGEIVVNMLAAQKEVIVHRIVLGVAHEKKQALVEALREDSKVDQEITRLSTDFETELLDFIQDRALDARTRERSRLDRLDAELAAGRITEAAHAAERAFVERDANTARANLDGRLELMLRSHFSAIERTLQLFVEQRLRVETL